MIKKIIAILILTTSYSYAASEAVGEVSSFVHSTSERVMEILKKPSSDSEKQAQLTSVFTDTVDINWIARFAVGKNWQQMSATQQSEYISNYRKFLISSYVPVFKKYNGQKVLIKHINPVGNEQYVVTTEIQSDNSGVPYKVEYRVKRTDGQYKVRDIIAEGVSMINTQRSDFGSIVAERGIPALNQDLLAKAK